LIFLLVILNAIPENNWNIGPRNKATPIGNFIYLENELNDCIQYKHENYDFSRQILFFYVFANKQK